MHQTYRCRSAAGLVACVLLLVAAGCSKSTPPNESSGTGSGPGAFATSAESIAESGRRTAQGTGQFELVMTSLGTARGDTEVAKATGQFDTAKRQFQLAMELAGFASQIADSSGLGGLGLTDQLFDEPIEMVGDGDNVYTKSAFLNTLLGGDPSKPWVRFSARDEAGKSVGRSMTNIVPFGSAAGGGASAVLDTLQGASGEVKELGTETIDGVSTRHLSATIDPDRLKAKGIASQFGDQSYPVEVWIAGDGVVRRVQYEIDPSVALPGGGLGALGGLGDLGDLGGDGASPLGQKLRMTMDISDAGRPVSVVLPPAAEVSESAGLDVPGGDRRGAALPPVGGNRSTGTTR